MPNRGQTIADHRERVNRVLANIRANMDKPLALETPAVVRKRKELHA